MAQSNDRGYAGEQSMGFYWGERGYFLVDGPSGAAGHNVNDKGFDGVAFNPTTNHMVIYDNKSFKDDGKVYAARAINENVAKNLATLESKVSRMGDFPSRGVVLSNIQAARTSLSGGSNWPKNVQLAVSNAGGQSSGVGGKLANGTISFIDYNAAPSPGKVGNGGSGSGTTTARTGDRRRPNAGPVLNNTFIDGLGGALALLQKWTEEMSMWNTAFAAMNDIENRQDEILREQQANPAHPVYIRVIWKVDFDNNPNMPKIYRYLGAEIQNGATGRPAALYDGNQKSYLMVIPALSRGGTGEGNGSGPDRPLTWRDRYTYVTGALYGDRSHGGDPVEALRILNGLAMFDILPILSSLRKNDAVGFDKLFQAIHWPSANIGRARLMAAFKAIIHQQSGHLALQAFLVECSEYAGLPDAQKKDIREFLTGRSESKPDDDPAGEWDVSVSKWRWIYKFDRGGTVTWRDPFYGKNGSGKWSLTSRAMKFKWNGSNTVEEWTAPLSPDAQGGFAVIENVRYGVSAKRRSPA